MNGKLVILLLTLAAVSGRPDNLVTSQNYTDRIIGGHEAVPHSSPWAIHILRLGSHQCAGALITPEWILTAGYCTGRNYWLNMATYTMVAGDHNTETDDPEEQVRQVVQMIVHPERTPNARERQFDIGLIRVSPPFEINEFVQTIALPPKGMQSPTMVNVAGWGRTVEGGSYSTILQTVDIPFMNDVECQQRYDANPLPYPIWDHMYCAGGNGVGFCSDQGAPLTWNVGGNNYLGGVFSFSSTCGRYPSVSSEVSYFLDWINLFIHPLNDNSTFVEQNEGCGGVVVGSSGQVSYGLGGAGYRANENCVWTLRTNDATDVRVEVYELGNLGDRLILSILDYEYNDDGQIVKFIEILEPGVYNVTGPIVFLTLVSDNSSTGAEGFRLHFYGVGFAGATGMSLSNYHLEIPDGLPIGDFHYPLYSQLYAPSELVTIVIPSSSRDNTTLTWNTINLESTFENRCYFDWIHVYTIKAGKFFLEGTYCGGDLQYPLPLPPTVVTDGPILLIFMTSETVHKNGFSLSWE